MSENEEAIPAKQDNGGIVLDLSLSFAPSWARTSPDANIQRYRDERADGGEDGEGRHGGRDGGRDRRPQRTFDDRDRRKPDRRPPRKEFDGAPPRAPGSEMPRPETRAAVADLRGPRPEGGFRPDSGPRQDRGAGGDRRDYRAPRPEYPPLPIEIRVLPEQKALGAVIRRIQTSHRAFPLRDIAWLFLDNPASCLIRVEPLKDQQLPLFQCKVCGLPALTEEEIRAHLVNRHMDDFFDVEEIDCEPPSGAFVCVARCGLSGELLGPPNHHSFNSKVHEMLRTKYPSMTEEAYRSRIETVRETEVIEKWRQQCTRKKIYRRKGAAATVAEPVPAEQADGAAAGEPAEQEPAPKAPPMERDVAELVFMREILPAQIASAKHLICTAAVAMQTSSRPLFFALKDTLNRERRFPASLFFALRGAFRHRNLHLFRVNDPKGQDFVMLKQPVVLDPTHTATEVRNLLTYVNEHAACTKVELVTALAGADEGKLKETLTQLAWLVEKGHVIEYYNDVLSAPIDYPAFRFLPGEKQQGSGPSVQPAPRRSEAPGAPAAQQPASAQSAEAVPVVSAAAEDVPAPVAEDVPAVTDEETVAAEDVVAAEEKVVPAEAVAPAAETPAATE
jgi:hypothetical protein